MCVWYGRAAAASVECNRTPMKVTEIPGNGKALPASLLRCRAAVWYQASWTSVCQVLPRNTQQERERERYRERDKMSTHTSLFFVDKPPPPPLSSKLHRAGFYWGFA